MADKKISELPSITGANVDDANDTLPIVDASTDTTKQITREDLFKGIDGNVGIGTSSPSEKLTVSVPSNTGGVLFYGGSQSDRGLKLSVSNAEGFDNSFWNIFQTAENNGSTLAFGTRNLERMRIDSSGNVGIGTSSPSAPLDVNGDAEINGLTVGRGSGGVSSNTAVGSDALNSNSTGSSNTAAGKDALYSNTTGLVNSSFGSLALKSNTTGSGNVAVGYASLNQNTTASDNTAVGTNALNKNTTGANNTANGYAALFKNTTGGANVAVGLNALYNNEADYNTGLGYKSLSSNTTGSNNVGTGAFSLYLNTTGSYNTASGYQALYNNTTGSFNTANGYAALYDNTTGHSNSVNGINALYSNTTGSNNVGFGRGALSANTTGSGNFGAAFMNASGTYAPVFNPTTHDNRVVMGHTGVTNAYVQVAWTVVSDARDKTEIEALEKGLDFVEQLNPVSYKFRKDRDTEETTGKKRYGFLAQEVLEVEGDDNVIVDTEDLDKLKMTHEELIPVLVKAIQELKAEVDLLKAQ